MIIKNSNSYKLTISLILLFILYFIIPITIIQFQFKNNKNNLHNKKQFQQNKIDIIIIPPPPIKYQINWPRKQIIETNPKPIYRNKIIKNQGCYIKSISNSSRVKYLNYNEILQFNEKNPTGGVKFCGPDYVVLGFVKCGTTALYCYLLKNPAIYTTYIKDNQYFIDQNYLNHRIYLSLTDYLEDINLDRKIRVGDQSPGYIYKLEPDRSLSCNNTACDKPVDVDRTFKKLKQSVAEGAPLIVILRDPVAMAWSNYLHYKYPCEKNLDVVECFAQRIEVEIAQFEECIAARGLWDPFCAMQPFHRRGPHLRILNTAIYVLHLHHAMRILPTHPFCFLSTYKLRHNPQDELRRFDKCVGIDNGFDYTAEPIENSNDKFCQKKEKNTAKYRLKKRLKDGEIKMSDETRKRLENFFTPFNDLLYQYTDRHKDEYGIFY